MKTIKIFLASSEELDYDRMAFGNLIRRLDDAYEKRGIRIKLFEWEDYDAAFNNRRKQDEYNAKVRESDIFLALFYKKAGKFTIEEFDVASEEFKAHASPRVYTYCRDLQPDDEESPELADFKRRLFEEMGHYWCRYDSRESLQLQFVMQLQLVENSQSDALKVEDGSIMLDGMCVARLDNLQFAAANEDYTKMQQELAELCDEIEEMQLNLEKKQQKLEKKKAKVEKDPDDEEYQEEYQEVKEEVEELIDRLQPKLDKYNRLKEEFAEYQKLLFDTAKRVAQLQGERITERMRRAMVAFNEGKVREANIILDEAEADARRNLEDYKQSKEITEQKRQTVISSIEELLLKASTVLADASIPIEERIERAEKIYEQADEMAKESEYDEEKYIKLLMNYGGFLNKYAHYDHATKVCLRLLAMSEKRYGTEHPNTVTAYDGIGQIYCLQGNYHEALEYCSKALTIREKILGKTHPDTATSYNNVGAVYDDCGEYSKALEYYFKSMEIWETVLGKEHPTMSWAYNNIGTVYFSLGDTSKALEYHLKSLAICEKVLGKEHPDTATTYNNLGTIYCRQGNYSKALEYYFKDLEICEKTFGKAHPDTATSYNNIGAVYESQSDYPMALEYYFKALAVFEKVFGESHPNMAVLFCNIGVVYLELSQFGKALEYTGKALEIATELNNNPFIATFHNRLGRIYALMGDQDAAQEHFQQTIDMLPEDHPEVMDSKERLENLN